MSIKGSIFFMEGPILHQLVKMKAFIVISFALASLVAAAPDSSSGKNAFFLTLNNKEMENCSHKKPLLKTVIK